MFPLQTFLISGLALLYLVSGRVGEEDQMELRYRISEELPERSFVGDVLQDSYMESRHESGIINQLKFRFLAPPTMNFEVDENNGILNTNGRIDRDGICGNKKKCEVKLDVVALVPEPMTFIEIIKVIIEILDVNDNWPFFSDTEITHEILESAVRGSSFVIPTAIDPDSGPSAVQTYHLEPKSSQFRLDIKKKVDGSTDVRLVLQEQLDHERRDSYKFKVVAIDGGNPAKSGSLNLNIIVHDTNDNSPRFQNTTYECTIPENLEVGSVIKRVNARDRDSGLYGQVLYNFSPRTENAYGHLFGIKNTTGDIFIKGIVDYEKSHVYHLVVTAHDRGPDSLPADATVIVQVMDTNDNAPQVTVNTLTAPGTNTAEVLENEDAHTFVAQLTVSDPDTGVNGLFQCHLSNGKFELTQMFESEYKITTRAKLDREEIPEYNLAITCKDQGREPQLSVKHLRVKVLDVNDNKPIFSKARYVATITENNYVAAFVVQVNATDRDAGDNANIMYQLEHNALENFRIDPKNGAITTRSVFDRERTPEMRFFVNAVDHGYPAQSGSAEVVVRVEDMNDESPKFTNEPYSFSVPENAAPPIQVGFLHAEDKDSREHSTFTFTFLPDREVAGTFSLDPHTGEIKTKVSLDREEKGLYQVPVAVIDTSNPPMSSTTIIDIHVDDENDNTPTFEFPSELNNTIQIPNLLPRGYVFAKILAHDHDIGANGNITYTFVSGSGTMLFGIDSSAGSLIVKTDLTNIDYREFELTIKAEDQGVPRRHSLSHGLKIAVNSSIPFSLKVEAPKEPLLSGHNFTIVVCLGTLSGVIMVILCVTIISIRRQEARRRNHKYNCRMEALKILHTTREQTKECDDNISVTKVIPFPIIHLITDLWFIMSFPFCGTTQKELSSQHCLFFTV